MRTILTAAIFAACLATPAAAWDSNTDQERINRMLMSGGGGGTAFQKAGRDSISRALQRDPTGAAFMLDQYNIDLEDFAGNRPAYTAGGAGGSGLTRSWSASPERPGQAARDKMDEMFALEHDPAGRSYYDTGGGSQTAARAAGIRTTGIEEAVIDERRAINQGESGGIGGSGIGGGRNDEGVGSFGGASRDTGVSSFDGFSGGVGEMSGRSFGGIGGRF